LPPPPRGREGGLLLVRPVRGSEAPGVPRPLLDERAAHALGLGQPLLRDGRRPVRPSLLEGGPPRPAAPVTERYDTRECDVLVIGAGGAGLRAAIEASGRGARTALVCKSLLGKAHTVMAEGGIAAALAHVDAQDSWQTHFRDTMRGGGMLNHWRMA